MAGHGFTPGPWALIERGDERYIVSETESDWDGDRKMICDLFRGGYSYDDAPHASRANAKLIAASPTLLEALEPFSGWDFTGTAWEHAAGHEAVLFDHKTGRAITLDDFRAVTAAITLATGKDA